jgi:uncharacterized protein (DUF342 family)
MAKSNDEKSGRNTPPTSPPQQFQGNKNDGSIYLSFSEADLEVWADVNPPSGMGMPLSANTVGAILGELNVNYGIRWDVINRALNECGESGRPVKHVLIAKGEPPDNEVGEYFDINPHLSKQRSQSADESGRIDYRSRSPFTIVKKDLVLAKLRPPRSGKDGINTHGDVIPFKTVRPQGVTGGINTRTEGNVILSEINGQLIENKGVLHVRETLEIKGGVGYATGNISFPGDVKIGGPVSDGFKIFSGGSIMIKQTFDVTEAVSKGDLIVAGGIIGRGAALLKAGGCIRTKFIENCRAAARKTVYVDREINNSIVFTLDRIEMSDKGIILGSDVYAVHGIKAGGIGKKIGKPARIHCGIDFTAQQEKEKLNNQLRIIAAKLGKLRELMADNSLSADKRAKIEELNAHLTAEQQTASARLGELLGQINADDKATVEVSGEITAGTLIEICQVALFVTEPLRKVRVRLNSPGGALVSEPL